MFQEEHFAEVSENFCTLSGSLLILQCSQWEYKVAKKQRQTDDMKCPSFQTKLMSAKVPSMEMEGSVNIRSLDIMLSL